MTMNLLLLASGFTLPSLRRAFPAVGPSDSSLARLPSHRVCMAVDKTKEGEYPHPHEDDYKFGDITLRVIRDMTGNADYRFGDGSKAIASATTDAAEAAAAAVLDAGGTAVEAGAAAKKVLDDSGYQFGDLTKGAIKGFEGQVRSATGNEEYKFGSRQTSLVTARPDISKTLAKGLFGALEKGAAAAKKKIDDSP
ncbi:hypothetical protein EMIHUDRAFT_440037 [Emiliania huxleyi CCMP1516]|uniref:Senescence domain-containing protein n=2 Tax=Emiliania huxleyi TaxID=2903 RepID=A0A0D3KSQ7_EMIH1|nr:hypothetical protein EMIHUDRAFT_440037 [Emiliania huxleyi CCMP1516]EOD38792.1 hypothetical protein EMIHUDRAFT_440037 [Emiliania huxleyi CCMP1516]|eukprot:XP_005791221.1 hypothetical protein EMIHUDRAFT_440037 [Emiliania huxleyi CCMP1516]